MGSVQPAIRQIAIIGAGPTGLAFAKFLIAEKVFDTIDIFEQRSRVGGIWNLSEAKASQHIPLPQTNPNYGTKQFSSSDASPTDAIGTSLEFESPLYDNLETNIPKSLMAYSEKPFTDDLPLFPGHLDVLQYLEDYAEEVRHLIKFRTKVFDVAREDEVVRDIWHLTAQDLESGHIMQNTYDAIVVANGHYTVPKVPEVKGLQAWNAAYPNTIIHSKAYRRPDDYKGRRVLVIGNSASGLDIAAQIAEYSSHPLFLSLRSASLFQAKKVPEWREDIDELDEFLPPDKYDRAVRTKRGLIVEKLDAIIFATGYFYTYPFLSNLPTPIISDGLRAQNFYQHLLHTEYPTLAIPVLNLKVIPFPLAENQAAVVARLWSGRLPIPNREEMRDWGEREIASKGSGKDFHLMRFPEDVAQLNDLFTWAKSARPGEGLENNGYGKLGTYRDEEQVWLRSIFPELKAAFMARGGDRNAIRKVEELGFSFEDWRARATQDELKVFERAHVPT